MKRNTHEVTSGVWNKVLAERYWFSPDLDVGLPKHTHDEYQIGMALTDSGEYEYRRAFHRVPVGSISVIHPGEVHSGCGFKKREQPTEFQSFYIPPSAVTEIVGRETPFVEPITVKPALEAQLRNLHSAIRSGSISLAQEELWQHVIRRLFSARNSPESRTPDLRDGLHLVREYIDEHATERITLSQLAELAGLTPWHLSRAFHVRFGIRLHAYQTQRRIDLAKRLLLSGLPASEVALRTGFSHQSHLGKHFRRLVNVAPVSYQRAGLILGS